MTRIEYVINNSDVYTRYTKEAMWTCLCPGVAVPSDPRLPTIDFEHILANDYGEVIGCRGIKCETCWNKDMDAENTKINNDLDFSTSDKRSDKDKLYSLFLHESIDVTINHKSFTIIRVPGGWVYRSLSDSTFVPYVKE